ncbi:MAG: aminotransferase class V-fold PLP-dependent enzyme [Candidatus Dormibacteraeota bacterium]|nr:aminotransferase class V-fold PLP-dependent enzyme [Candidatus Dormibacteraeota bacterium]
MPLLRPNDARDLFPITRQCLYLNHAGNAPLSERARAALEELTEQLTSRPYRAGHSQELAEEVRSALSRLVGAEPDTLALVRSTAHGLSLLAGGLNWHAGDNVVGARGEYPANLYPWLSLRERGVEFRLVEPEAGRITPKAVLSLVDERTRVVALSHVQFWNGYRLDLAQIGAELDRRGVIFAVDLIQSAGALQLDLDRLPVDFAAAGGYKWQLGPIGMGFCYCRPELVRKLSPVLVGTGSVTSPFEYFQPRYEPAATARRFEESALSLLDLTGYLAGLQILLDAGPAQVEERVLGLAARLREGLDGLGYELVEPWPRAAAECSGIVSFRRPGSPASAVWRELTAAGIVSRLHGDLVRLSPHFYNLEREMDRVLEVLAPLEVR